MADRDVVKPEAASLPAKGNALYKAGELGSGQRSFKPKMYFTDFDKP